MDTIKWGDLPEGLRSRKEVDKSELPENFDFKSVPRGVTIVISRPLTGEAGERSWREMRELCEKIGARAKAMGMTEEKLQQILDEIKEERMAETLAARKQKRDE